MKKINAELAIQNTDRIYRCPHPIGFDKTMFDTEDESVLEESVMLTEEQDELRSALEEAFDRDVSEEAIGAVLSQLASELGLGEGGAESHEDDDRPESIRLNPFVNDGAGSDQLHIRKHLFGAEGG